MRVWPVAVVWGRGERIGVTVGETLRVWNAPLTPHGVFGGLGSLEFGTPVPVTDGVRYPVSISLFGRGR